MSIDVFGHGLRYLPTTNPEYYSDGPDRKRGPSKCRGSKGGCYDGVTPTPHDHSCCCDPCRHTFVDTCGTGHCCRCIPKQICALFTPDTPSGNCATKAWTMEPSTSGTRSTYSFSPNGDTIELSVGADEDGYPGSCTWRLYSAALSIDESQAINHSGAIHCQAPPAFTIESFNLIKYDSVGTPSDCFGTITFTEKTLAKVPFIYRWQGQEEFAAVSCGSCSQICQVLCVRRGNEYDSTTYTRVDFLWDEYTQQWNANDDSGHYLTLFEEYGQCYLKLDSITPATLQGDLVLIDPTACSTGMDIMVTDEVGDYIKISCNPCSCWRYVCGSCRCVCRDLCVVGMEDGVLVSPFTISWDKDALRWGDDTFSVTPSRDADGNCQATVTGYADPVAMPNACGSNLAFRVSESVADQLSTGLVNYLYFSCQNCAVECGNGTCLDACDEVPKILYAEVSADNWTAMLGCDPMVLCFETITIALAQVFVSTLSNPAGEYRWIGCGIISCKDCTPATRKNYLVCIDIGCDGVGTFSVDGEDVVVRCSESISFTLPCEGSAVWDFSFGPFACDGLNGCCDEGGFLVTITE